MEEIAGLFEKDEVLPPEEEKPVVRMIELAAASPDLEKQHGSAVFP